MTRVRARTRREAIDPGPSVEQRVAWRLDQMLGRRRFADLTDSSPTRSMRIRQDQAAYGSAYALAHDDAIESGRRWTDAQIRLRAARYERDAIEAARDFASRPRPFGQWSSAADMPIWYRRPDPEDAA